MGAGSYGAAGFVSWLREKKKKQKKDLPTVGGLAMLAGTIAGKAVTGKGVVDLSDADDLEVVAVLAREDTIVPPDGLSEAGTPVRDGINGRCPPCTETFVIEGGNHAGFGHYGPQTFPFNDGDRTIPLEEQQEIAATKVAALVKRLEAKRKNRNVKPNNTSERKKTIMATMATQLSFWSQFLLYDDGLRRLFLSFIQRTVDLWLDHTIIPKIYDNKQHFYTIMIKLL